MVLDRAALRLRELQEPDGHWRGDYGGPLFLLPGLVIAYAISGQSWTEHQRTRMITYLENVQNDDGGYGLHVEDQSTMLGTTLNYVAMRLLGVAAGAERTTRAREFIRREGGAESIPTWGKCWLAVLGVYEWDGVNPLLPELWLLPRALPIHPSNFWCHTRAVFLPMSYLYGRRARGEDTETTRLLRGELYVKPYEQIDWRACRNKVHARDAYSPHTRLLDSLNGVMNSFERARSVLGRDAGLRERALAFVIDQIHHEDESTAYLDIGPVSKALHIACVWFEDPSQPALRRHLERVGDYLWDGRDGMKMQGYNGSQFWDLAFSMQAVFEHAQVASSEVGREVLEGAFDWLEKNQVAHDVPEHERYFRNRTRGAFPFSTAEQAWPVTDCTAEGIKAALKAKKAGVGALAPSRLQNAVDVLLAEQNDDGGWSEYERARAGRWLERLNAAEVFGDIMIGYSHPECSSACIQGLAAFRTEYGSYRRAEIDGAIERGAQYLRDVQCRDGSFYGCWGICFTYATWFGIEGLITAGLGAGDTERVFQAADFLVEKQRGDGSFGESHLSCVEKRWVDHERGQPVQTAWAMLGLLSALEHVASDASIARRTSYRSAAQRAARWLASTQSDDGWYADMVYGVFNRNCMINYDNYRYYFPLWALARFARLRAQSLV
jgi:squalene/oxidosqualene cyclase-like protein